MKKLICINKFGFTLIEKRLCFDAPDIKNIVATAVAEVEKQRELKKEKDKNDAKNLRDEVNKIFESFPVKWRDMVHNLSGLEALKEKGSIVAQWYLIAHEAYRLGDIANKNGEYSKAKENFTKSKEFYNKVSEYFNERQAKIKSLQEEGRNIWGKIPPDWRNFEKKPYNENDPRISVIQPRMAAQIAWDKADKALIEENYEDAIISYQDAIAQYKIIARIAGVEPGNASPGLSHEQYSNTPAAAPATPEAAKNPKEEAEKAEVEKAKTKALNTWKMLQGQWTWKDRNEIIKNWKSQEAKDAANAGNTAWDSAEGYLNRSPENYAEAKKQFDIANSEYQKLVDWQQWFKNNPAQTSQATAVPLKAPGAAPSTVAGKKSPETDPRSDTTRLEETVLAILEKHKYVGKEKQEHFDEKQLAAIKTDIEASVKKMNLKPRTEINFGAVWVKVKEDRSIMATVTKPAEPEDSKKEADEKLAAEKKALHDAAIKSLRSVRGESIAAITSYVSAAFSKLSDEQKGALNAGEIFETLEGIRCKVTQDKSGVALDSINAEKLKTQNRGLYAYLESQNSDLLPKKSGEPSGTPETKVAKKEAPPKEAADAVASDTEGERI